jgi:hypothetical protein
MPKSSRPSTLDLETSCFETDLEPDVLPEMSVTILVLFQRVGHRQMPFHAKEHPSLGMTLEIPKPGKKPRTLILE